MKKKTSKRIKIRKAWKINPATRIEQGLKKHRRQNAKKELKEALKRLKDEEGT